MKVSELIAHLQQFPPDAKVLLAEELGTAELKEESVSLETMNYIEYAPYWNHHAPTYGWEYPSDYKRKVLASEVVVVIS